MKVGASVPAINLAIYRYQTSGVARSGSCRTTGTQPGSCQADRSEAVNVTISDEAKALYNDMVRAQKKEEA